MQEMPNLDFALAGMAGIVHKGCASACAGRFFSGGRIWCGNVSRRSSGHEGNYEQFSASIIVVFPAPLWPTMMVSGFSNSIVCGSFGLNERIPTILSNRDEKERDILVRKTRKQGNARSRFWSLFPPSRRPDFLAKRKREEREKKKKEKKRENVGPSREGARPSGAALTAPLGRPRASRLSANSFARKKNDRTDLSFSMVVMAAHGKGEHSCPSPDEKI